MSRKPKGPEIGLHQSTPVPDRRSKPTEIHRGGPARHIEKAQGFWQAARQLQSHGREAEILKGFAEEEAAKVLILVDAVRCPPNLITSRLSRIIGWFYDHLARLIYAEAVSWKPTNLAELREYVDRQRRGHYLEGHAGEYIMPNWAVYQHESRLYADIEAYQDGELSWSEPQDPNFAHGLFGSFAPPALRVAEAMEQVGMFTTDGLKVVSEIWGRLEYRDKQDHHDGEKLTEAMLTRLLAEHLMLHTAQKENAATLYRDWQIPMYNLEFSLIPVTLEELEAEQERELWSMVGDPR